MFKDLKFAGKQIEEYISENLKTEKYATLPQYKASKFTLEIEEFNHRRLPSKPSYCFS